VTGALRTVYRYWILLLALWIVVLVFLAGYGIFDTTGAAADGTANEDQVEDAFSAHGGFGFFFGPASLLLFLFSLGARLGRNRVLLSLAVLVLWFVQEVLAGAGEDAPFVGALHPVNALVMLGLVGWLAYGSWRKWTDLGEPARM
jgi:hypothetical protein